VITRISFLAAVALAAAVGVAPTASADPTAFGVLSCSCGQPVLDAGAIGTDQTKLGIQNGIADLLAVPTPGAPVR
jgi:hypothetical protein